MKVSELLAELNKLLESDGDLQVIFNGYDETDYHYYYNLSGVDITYYDGEGSTVEEADKDLGYTKCVVIYP